MEALGSLDVQAYELLRFVIILERTGSDLWPCANAAAGVNSVMLTPFQRPPVVEMAEADGGLARYSSYGLQQIWLHQAGHDMIHVSLNASC